MTTTMDMLQQSAQNSGVPQVNQGHLSKRGLWHRIEIYEALYKKK